MRETFSAFLADVLLSSALYGTYCAQNEERSRLCESSELSSVDASGAALAADDSMRAVPFARRPRAHCPSPSAFPVAVLEHTHSHCTHTSRRRAGAGRTREEWPSPRLALNQFARPQNGLISAAAVPISGDRSRLGLSLSLNSTRLNRFIRNARSAAQQESFIVCSGLVHCTVDEEYFLSGPHTRRRQLQLQQRQPTVLYTVQYVSRRPAGRPFDLRLFVAART